MKSWALAPGWQSRHHLRFQAMPSIQIHDTYLGYASTGNSIQPKISRLIRNRHKICFTSTQANLIASTLLDAYHSEYRTLSDAAGAANVSLSAIGEAHHLMLWVTNSITCTRASWSSNLELRPTTDELTCTMPQGRNTRQMLREPSRLSEYV